jgi:hypothetical protein
MFVDEDLLKFLYSIKYIYIYIYIYIHFLDKVVFAYHNYFLSVPVRLASSFPSSHGIMAVLVRKEFYFFFFFF